MKKCIHMDTNNNFLFVFLMFVYYTLHIFSGFGYISLCLFCLHLIQANTACVRA